jgi:hypothetical protein
VTDDVELTRLLSDTSLGGVFYKGMAGAKNHKNRQDGQSFDRCAAHCIFAFRHQFSPFSLMDFMIY